MYILGKIKLALNRSLENHDVMYYNFNFLIIKYIMPYFYFILIYF